MEDNLDFVLNNNLSRLKKYLNYEISSSVLFFLSFLAPIFMFFALGAAIIFTPFMLYVLVKEKKTAWLITFVIIIIITIILSLILAVQFEFAAVLMIVPMAPTLAKQKNSSIVFFLYFQYPIKF